VESVRGYAGFFYDDAVKRLDTLFEIARKQCKNVFSGGGTDRQPSPGRPAGYYIQQGINDRYRQLCWMATDDPLKIQALEKMPLLEYFLLLDKRLGDIKKQLASAK
jgi:hypothetical protein